MTDIVPDAAVSAAALTHVDALRAGVRVAEFEIQELLGVGGFGLVYRAYDHSLHRTVAIKEYMPAALATRKDGQTVSIRSSADEDTYQSGLQSFVAEARLLAQFDHPSLVKVYRFWEGNNTAYMVMPLYRGMTLKQARSQMAAPPPEAWLRTLQWSILQALHLLHKQGTLHRDVSPDNIFLQDVGPPVLLDLGAARRALTDKSRQLTAILKVNYAPIEQYAEVEGLKQGPWTDLYALAAAVYGCIRNEPPPPATARAVRDTMPAPRIVAAAVKEHFGIEYSDKFVRAITHALAVQPAGRPQSLSAYVTEMELRAPARISKFDWRAELGAPLLSQAPASSAAQAMEQTLLAQTVMVEAPAVSAARSKRWLRPVGWLASLLAAGLVVGLYLVFAAEHDTPAKEPSAGAPAVAVSPGVEAAGHGAASPASGASAPVAGELRVAALPAAAASAAVPKAAASAPVRKAPAPPPRPKPKPVPATPVPEPQQQPAKVVPKPVPAKAVTEKAATSKVLCEDVNFFTRPMCIHRECQKPENARLEVCVDDRQRYRQ